MISVAELMDEQPLRGLNAVVNDALDHQTRGFTSRIDAVLDPIARLMDPEFRETTWEYEWSQIGPDIPGQLHARQLEALEHSAKHRWLFWGNQTGKTTLGAVDTVLKSLGRHAGQLSGRLHGPPWVTWASALTWELWENILLPEILTWIPKDRLIAAPPPHRKSLRRDVIIRADNGKVSRIVGKAAEQGAEKYQSARVDGVWLDEEHPESVYDEMQPRLLRYGGSTIATMTPLKGLTWVHARIYEPVKSGRVDHARHWFSHAGIADNPSIKPEEIAALTEELKHSPAQLAARLSGQFVRPYGAVLPWDAATHLRDMDLGKLVQTCSCYCGLDLGKWRFALTVWLIDGDENVRIIEELFIQHESGTQKEVDIAGRAKAIHDTLWALGIREATIVADNAEPDTVRDLNAALEALDSPFLIVTVHAHNKIILAGVDRLENLLNRGALTVRRGMGNGRTWYLGRSSSRPGKPVEGSRWMWEASNWQYPKTEDGKIQKDEPDDATADGADMMAASRYVAMHRFGPVVAPAPKKAPTVVERIKRELEEMDEAEEERESGSRYGFILRQ